VIMCRADIAHKYTDNRSTCAPPRIRTRTYGAYEVHATFAPLDEDVSPTVYAAKAAYEARRHRARGRRRRATSRHRTPATRGSSHAETGLCADGGRRSWSRDGATEIHGSIPVNTDAG